jgi:hypothetical protein
LRRNQFEAYLNKVFNFHKQVEALPEGRLYPQHPWKNVFEAVFFGCACQFATLHEIETECREGALQSRIGPISEDTFRYSLQRQEPDPILDLGVEVAKRLKRNGILHSQWARGRVVVAVDGIEICSSYARCCDTCMERQVQRKVDGELQEDIQTYHRIVAVTVVSSPFSIPLGIRFQQEGEDEVECALPLLQQLHDKLGRRFIDLLVADALYMRKPFVEAIEKLGWDWVFTLKANQPELLEEAKRLTSRCADFQQSSPKQQLQLWYEPEVYWPVADRSVQVVKAVRDQKITRVDVRKANGKRISVREEVEKQSTDFFASNVELGSIPSFFIYQLGKSRWTIDVEVFQTITTDSHLKYPSVHQNSDQALVVLTMIRFLAYMLSLVFFHRQVLSHRCKGSFGFCSLAKTIAYQFLAEPFDTS